MIKTMKNLKPLMLFFLLLLTACSSTALPANSAAAAGQTASATDAAIAPEPQETAKGPGSPTALKPIYSEPAQPMPEEPHGVVYKGYLLDYHEALYGPMGPASLANACRSLDIKMTADASREDWAPETVTLERDGVRLVFKISGDRDEYYRERAYPSIPYKVFKDGKEISFQGVFFYKGCMYAGNLEELLSALDISFFESGGNTYVDSDKATEVKGRLLYAKETELEKGGKAEIRLLYNYDAGNRPGYSDVELQITGKDGRYVKIFDRTRRGSAGYYAWGAVSEYTAGKDRLVKVDLSDAPSNGRMDSCIYKISDSIIVPVYTTGFGGLPENGITVETDSDGRCTFVDAPNNINRPLNMKIDRPDTIFDTEVTGISLETDAKSGECLMTVLNSISYKKPFLFVSSVYHYKGDYFSGVKNTLSETYRSPGDTNAPLYEYDAYHPAVSGDTGREFRETGKLSKITMVNMNDENNADVTLTLPEGWYAKGFTGNQAEGFEFEMPKNKHITKAWMYDLYNANAKRTDFYQYGIDGGSGTFNLPSYYRDHPENILTRNHAQIREKAWSGQTVLGKGDIYIVDCDLPREKQSGDRTTYDEIYVWIPVEGEQFAYNLAVDVPLDEKTGDYLAMVKRMLGAQTS